MVAQAVFRCEATSQIGAGHVMRCLVFAETLGSMGWSTVFATHPDTLRAAPSLASSNSKILLFDQQDALSVCPEAQLAIVDHYSLDADYERNWAVNGSRVVVFDDLADRRHVCEILVDPTPGRSPSAYSILAPTSTRLLLGSKFALVGSAWRKQRRKTMARLSLGRPVERILVLMGATDPLDTTSRILAALARLRFDVDVDVVLGPGAPHLARVANALGPRMMLHVDPTDLPSLAATADLAIGAAGSSSFERAVLGLPSLLIPYADNQRFVAAAFAEAGAAEVVSVDLLDDPATLARQLSELVADSVRRKSMSQAASQIADGRGSMRVLAEIAGDVVTNSGAQVRLRLAEADDESWLLALQSEPGTREHFRNPSIPTAGEHNVWFDRILDDDGVFLAIVEVGRSAAGMVRLDRKNIVAGRPTYEVSIVVGATWRQRGVGRAALELVRRLAPAAVFEAHIVPSNSSSLNLFRRSGFQPLSGDLFRQSPV